MIEINPRKISKEERDRLLREFDEGKREWPFGKHFIPSNSSRQRLYEERGEAIRRKNEDQDLWKWRTPVEEHFGW